MLSKSLPHCISLYMLICTLYSSLSILHFSLSIEYCCIDFILYLHIIYYRRAITDHEGALSQIALYIHAICTCHVFCISYNTSLSSGIIVSTSLSQLLIPTHMGISGEFCVYIVFFLYFLFVNGSIQNLFTSSLCSHT